MMGSGRVSPRSLSLKGRALMWLAQREHSRDELRRKLLMRLRAEARAAQTAAESARAAALESSLQAGAEPSPQDGCDDEADPGAARAGAAAEVETLLDWLEANRYLSEARFIESRVNARATRYGTLRIGMELSRLGVALEGEALQQLRDTELPRAQAVWSRKFGAPAASPAERAKQMRFLAGRGFSAEVVRRVVRGGAAGDDDGE